MSRLAVACVLWLSLAPLLLAQSQSSTADLVGVVQDESGALLPGVDIRVANTETGFARDSFTDELGRYRIPLLPPGTYQVTFGFPGFATRVVQGVQLTVGQTADLDAVMVVATTDTRLTVVANTRIIERQKTVQSSTISEVEIENLPINGRNFLDFALLTPGVGDKNTLVTESAVQAPTSGLSFGGQDQRSNSVTIDGADNIDPISNSVRSTLSQEAIQEFQINRNSYSAEFGRARGGVINIVSKSGSNDFHGSAFFFFRNQALDARNTFSKDTDGNKIDSPFERYQFGATFGGPIVEDRTFFFASYEGLRRDESIFVTFLDDTTIFQPTTSQFDLFGFLGSTGVPSLELLAAAFTHPQFGLLWTLESNFPQTLDRFEAESGAFPFKADTDTFSFKLDHQATENNQMTFRFNYTDSFADNASFGALEGVSNGVMYDIRDLAFVFSDTHVFSPNTLNEFKFQFGRREFAVPTNDPFGPQLTIAGVAEFGREFFNPSAYDENIYQFTENITFIRGNHTLKAGVDLNITDFAGFAEVFLGGRFSFAERIPLGLIMDTLVGPGTAGGLIRQLGTPVDAGGLGRPDLIPNVLAPVTSLQSFNFGLPTVYLQGFGDPNTAFIFPRLAFYLQDTWNVSDSFTLNLGLRYDLDWRTETTNVINSEAPFQFENASINDRNDISPRIGFAWDIGGRGGTVVRGGYGIYYQNFFQAVAFVSQVLSGQIQQVFLPVTGLPGITDATSSDVYGLIQQGFSGEEALDMLGISPGTTPSVILPSAGDVVSPYSHQVSFGVEHGFSRDWSLALDYNLNRGLHLIRSRDINVNRVGENMFLGVRDRRFAQVNQIETSGNSIYHGFTANLRKRFTAGSSLNVAYTLGKAIDDTTDFITPLQPNDQTNVRAERALSSFDQRQRLVVSGIVESPWDAGAGQGFARNFFGDWMFSPIVTWATGRPFNLLNGFDRNNDTHDETDRPLTTDASQIGRNTGAGPGFFSADMRLSRRFRLPREDMYFEFLFEVFNLFNNVNYSGVNAVVGSQRLATGSVEGSNDIATNRPLGYTSALAPRQLQFGVRFVF